MIRSTLVPACAGVLMLVCGSYPLTAQQALQGDPRVAWLAENTVEVRSIEPADHDYSDLAPIREILAGVRVVLMGEAGHGDGATFLAKSRLVSFLHQELGFDVLVFESSFYDCARAWDLVEVTADIHATFRQCVWPLWAEREEVQALIDYVGSTQASRKPLALAGLDVGFAGGFSGDSLGSDLRRVLDSVGALAVEGERVDVFLDVAEHMMDYRARRLERPSPETIENASTTASNLAQVVEASSLPESERRFWALVLENLAADVPYWLRKEALPPLETVELRDRLMARNLLWLMSDRYPQRKFIVWSATLHNARNLHTLEVVEDQDTPWGITVQELYRDKRVMGDYLHETLGPEMYSLGFVAFEGYFNSGREEPERIEPAGPGSLEALLASADSDYALLDFRRSTPGGEWLNRMLPARVLGNMEMIADWSNVLDGVLFIREMTPSTRVAQ